jgi:SAM-dependent methyltransferase
VQPLSEPDIGPTDRVSSICACPLCHSALEREKWSLRCSVCDAVYALEDGIPILIPQAVGAPHADERWIFEPALGGHPRLSTLLERFRSRVSLTYKSKRARSLVDRFVGSYDRGKVILNVGAGRTRYGSNVVNLEIAPGPEIDIVGVAEFLPLATKSCDAVVLMAVLEHVQDARKTLSEAWRVLVPGGRLLVDVPFIQGFHPSPGDYRRYTEEGLRAELDQLGFVVEESGLAVGPGSAMAWITSEFLALLVSGRSVLGYRVARNLTRVLAMPIKYADIWLEDHPMANRIPSAVWAIAHTPEDVATTREHDVHSPNG